MRIPVILQFWVEYFCVFTSTYTHYNTAHMLKTLVER